MPTFNIQAGVWTGPYLTKIFRFQQLANLAWGRRVQVASTGGTTARGVIALDMNLLVASRTDIRGPLSSTGSDVIEVPAGSGRWYSVDFVDDIGRGFANEHRCAQLQQILQPTPLT